MGDVYVTTIGVLQIDSVINKIDYFSRTAMYIGLRNDLLVQITSNIQYNVRLL